MTKLMTMKWSDFAMAEGAPPPFSDLLSTVFSCREALLLEIGAEEVCLSVDRLGAPSPGISLSGVWMTRPIPETGDFPLCAQLCLPLMFRAQSVLVPFNAFSTITTERRTLASFFMRNILSGILAGVDVRYETAAIEATQFETQSRDLAVVYQYLLAKKLDEPALKDKNFHEKVVIAMYFPTIAWQSPLLAAGCDALAAYLRRDALEATVHGRFSQIRRDLFAYFC